MRFTQTLSARQGAVVALLAAALAFSARSAPAPQGELGGARSQRWSVVVERDEGELYCTVRADQDPLLDVLREIADASELSLDGLQGTWRRTLVSADLRRRPLRQALTYLLGSVGLRGEVRAGALYVREDAAANESSDELYESALAGYLRALREFPEHELADDAVRSQAQIEHARGRAAASRAHYEALIERYPESPLVPEAMFVAGTLLMREGAWQEASQRLSDLLRLEVEHDLEPRARLELAYCVAELGAFERALYMVDALEGIAPPADADEERRRAYVRIRAMAGLGQGRAALELLDEVDTRLGFATTRGDSLSLRAAAAESAGLREEAARAWLSYGRIAQGAERRRAYEKAAQLAMQGGDELSALFVSQLAAREGVRLEQLERAARARLSLDDAELGATTPEQRLARAERLLSAGLDGEALRALQAIEPLAEQFAAPERLRFVTAFTRAMSVELGLDTALAYLRGVLPAIEDRDARRSLYVLAAELLESEGRVADAIEAYRGRI